MAGLWRLGVTSHGSLDQITSNSCNRTTFGDRCGIKSLEEVIIAPRCPWQNPYAERLMANIRREVLDQVIILNEQPFQR